MFKKKLSILFCAGLMHAAEQAEYPFFESELKQVYDELQNQEKGVLKKIKDAYPNVPQAAWERYDEIQKEGFSYIKKKDEGTPACDKLPKSAQADWTPTEFENFLKQYTECKLEKNGIDPEAISIYYDHNDTFNYFKGSENSITSTIGFSYYVYFADYRIGTDSKSSRPKLFVNKKFFKNIHDIDKYLASVDKASAHIAELSYNKIHIMSHFVKEYYGENELKKEQFLQLNNELYDIQHENALIIAAMRSPDTADNLRAYIEKNESLPFNHRFDYEKIIKYLYKIKKIVEACV